ncbi:hypothetical protein FB567DRAFT_217419 [Paraphoma chrysanthemicola]|uniref:Uncharacterized protein n=1 Tax=Paraphoma chrysanthemicola TaxID=798071 RepID=A0A8K0QVA2_9PLEO|nr:hypothetical protein FB567DRAFT_217419 [Paraphoma chrysanthemicola]
MSRSRGLSSYRCPALARVCWGHLQSTSPSSALRSYLLSPIRFPNPLHRQVPLRPRPLVLSSAGHSAPTAQPYLRLWSRANRFRHLYSLIAAVPAFPVSEYPALRHSRFIRLRHEEGNTAWALQSRTLLFSSCASVPDRSHPTAISKALSALRLSDN